MDWLLRDVVPQVESRLLRVSDGPLNLKEDDSSQDGRPNPRVEQISRGSDDGNRMGMRPRRSKLGISRFDGDFFSHLPIRFNACCQITL